MVLTKQEKLGIEKQPQEKSTVDIFSHFEGLKQKSTKSSMDLYSHVLETNQIQPKVMSIIDNEEKTLDVAFLDPKESSSKEA